jgi:Tol biopolymer transport system component
VQLGAGERLGPYEIIGSLGKGGMGEVYQARDPRLNRMVALKVLPVGRMAQPERRQRFLQEAQLASNLQHPNIITIYEIGASDGVEYIVMELVRGRTLEAVIPRKGLRLNETLRIAGQIADALAAAHAAGIVHRDLKPGNIMVTDTGAVKVLDFGLAKLTEKAATEFDETRTQMPSVRTDDGTILGTAAYMSPEQADGKTVDARSDIFSFGAILYEMLSGQRAFPGDSKMSTLAAVINSEPKPLSGERLPYEVERIVARCLRKNVAKRAQHMSDVRLALEELLEESESGSLTAPAVIAKTAGRRWWIGVAALASLAVVGGGIWWTRSGGQKTAFEATPLTTLPGSEDGPSFSPDGTQVAYRGDQNKQWDIYVKLIGGGPALRLTTDAGTHWYPTWSPDGKWIAFTGQHTGGRNGVFLMSALGGPERLLAELDGDWTSADWSPDGKWIAVSPTPSNNFDPGSGVTLISVQSGERHELVKQAPEMVQTPFGCFSPDGRRLAFVKLKSSTVGQLHVADLTPDMRLAGKPRQITSGELGAAYPAWTTDGREIVFMLGGASSNGSLVRVRANGGSVQRIPGLGYTMGPISIARKGGRMAYSRGGIDNDIWRFDTKGEKASRKWIASTVYDASGEYSHDGKKIVFASNRSGSREIWVCDADGGNAVQLTHFGGPQTGTPRWSPDGRWIAFDSRPGNNPDVFVIGAEGSGLRRLTDQPGEDSRPAWSADGRWIYFSSDRSGRAEIWRMPSSGGPAEQVTKNGGASAYPSRDGEWIYYCANSRIGPLRRIRLDGSGDGVALDWQIPFLAYTAAPGGVYFVTLWEGKNRVQRLLPDGKIAHVLELPFAPGFGLSLSPDERYVLVTKPDENGTDLMLVENFH